MTIDTQSGAIEAGDILPDSTEVGARGHLVIGGCDVIDLVERHGTPLYVYDEATIRSRARAYRKALSEEYDGPALVTYAGKAYCAPWLLRLLVEEGLGLDVVSGGELYAATRADVPRDRIHMHGNNKSSDELEQALQEGVGRIVLDNLDEIELLARLTEDRGARQPVLLRVSPGVDAHTHAHLTTGKVDTKFGLGIETGQAGLGVRAILARLGLDLRGFHAHIGSLIDELEPYRESIERVFAFAAEMREVTGFAMREVSPGGGYGVRYTPDATRVSGPDMVRAVAGLVAEAAERWGFMPAPHLTVEPGRSIVASAAVALYRIGSIKTIPAGRTYVAVDGGMADNVRPTAYGSRYTALLANRASDPTQVDVAIAGKYCETGDILIQSVPLPLPRVGDVVAIPMSGAYQVSMASNYNLSMRPAVVTVADGRARLVRRRETFADLLAADVIEPVERAD
jgi:diaminopimelate decarboxylase